MSRAIDVIIPVYGNFEDAGRAIDAALDARNRADARFVVIDDASPQSGADSFFADIAAKTGVTLIRNPRNLGFPATVNLGMRLRPDCDVALLNSDTLVFDGWLDRLVQVFAENPRAATVTPMSNAATILSYPHWLVENDEPLEISWRALDALCAKLAPPPLPVPTGVGFCMLIRREALDEVGLFDAETFGQGYGEETDFCRRAAEAGWINFAAPNIFVWHRGGGSFGPARAEKCARAQALIEARHPGYAASIGRYIAQGPMRETWAALDALRVRSFCKRKRLLFGTGFGATPRVPDEARWLTLAMASEGGVWRRRWRLIAPASEEATPWILPNLPAIDSTTPASELQSLLAALGVEKLVVSGPGLLARPMARRLEDAATALSVPIIQA